MSSNPKSIQRSIQIGTRHPIKGISLLANTITKCIDNSTTLTKQLRIEFCVGLLSAIVDRSYQPHKKNLSKQLKNKSINSEIKILNRYPHKGLEVLVDLIIDELVNHQQCTQEDLFRFYSDIFSYFFSEDTENTKQLVGSKK